MDFFNAQRRAHRSTKSLIFLFVCAVLGIILGLYFLFALLCMWGDVQTRWWNPTVFALTCVGTLLVVGLGMLYKISQLRGGGQVVCRMMGAEPVPLVTSDKNLRRLRNIVEEMAIAAGVPVPALFYLAEESGINAFAAGFSPSDAAVCVTRGCVEQLNRDELQGVIAHEFSHVLNGDMRLNIRLIGVLHGILCISMAGWILLRSGHWGGGGRRGGVLFILSLGLGLVVLGSIGALFARLIQAAVSRQREFLADASAVQFTRNPAGISGALKKIGGLATKSRVRHAQAKATSHMFFANAMSGGLADWFATHPPIQERIAAIDPLFAHYARLQQSEAAASSASGGGTAGATTADLAGATAGFAGATARVSAIGQVQAIGQVTPQQMAFGRHVLRELPLAVTVALRDPFSARAVVYCLLLDRDSATRRQQFQQLQGSADPATLQETLNLSGSVHELPRQLRLPIIDLAMPALRTMSLQQARTFRENIRTLIEADRRVSLFEFTVEKILNRHLDSAFVGARAEPIRHSRIEEVSGACGQVLSMLAYLGHATTEAAERAYRIGAQHIGTGEVQMLPLSQCKRPELDAALDQLALASPEVKREALTAFAHAVASDGEMSANEAELLRAVSDAMECPMPPIPRQIEPAEVTEPSL